jgi:tight adherence protein B
MLDIALMLTCVAVTLFVYPFAVRVIEQWAAKQGAGNQEDGEPISNVFSLGNPDHMRLVRVSLTILLGLGGTLLGLGLIGPAVGAMIGWIGPVFYWQTKQRARLKALEQQLVTALSIMASAMRAGQSITQVVESTHALLPSPMREEFGVMVRQFRVGNSVAEVFEQFAKRVPLPDAILAVKAIVICTRSGGSLPNALNQIASTIKRRNAVESKIQTMTFGGRAQGLVVGLLPVFIGLGFYVIDPRYVGLLFTTLPGQAVVVVMVVLEVIAFFVIRRITTINI